MRAAFFVQVILVILIAAVSLTGRSSFAQLAAQGRLQRRRKGRLQRRLKARLMSASPSPVHGAARQPLVYDQSPPTGVMLVSRRGRREGARPPRERNSKRARRRPS